MIFRYKTDAMRLLLRHLSRGYIYWTAGSIEAKKWPALEAKFLDRYLIHATAQQRWRRKAKGQCNSYLVGLVDKTNPGKIWWWLLVTEGEGMAHDLEDLKQSSSKRGRLTMPDADYEALKAPRPGNSPAWTWRITADSYAGWEARLASAVQNAPSDGGDALRQALHSLQRVPGFAQSRKQAYALENSAVKRWKRLNRGEWPHKRLHIGWLGRYTQGEIVKAENIARTKTTKTSV